MKCEGCKLNSEDKGHWIYCMFVDIDEFLVHIDDCPCKNCLVKPTCIDGCEKRREILDSIDLKNDTGTVMADTRYVKWDEFS